MILCDTIKHHNKNGKPCALGFWHFLTSERIAGFSASLSAFNLDYQGVAKQVPEKVPKKYFFGFLFTLFLTSTTTLQRQKQ